MQLSPDQQSAVNRINAGSGPFFLTGPAGSGKSFVIKHLKKEDIATVVTASTGIAAQLIGGRTLHSFACIHPIKGVIPSRRANERIQICTTLIIDEISMVNELLLSQLYERFEYAGHSPKLVMVGDFLQLPPVDGEPVYTCELWSMVTRLRLTQIHRQADPEFISFLNDVRVGELTDQVRETLASRTVPALPDDCTHLVPHRATAEVRNHEKLEALPTKRMKAISKILECPNSGVKDADWKRARFKREILLKVGARVVLLNNDPDHRWVNGSTGSVVEIEKGLVLVKLDTGSVEAVGRVEEEVLDADGNACFVHDQYPIDMAWALTIHKAQGMTIDKVGVDLTNHFAAGQTYVALSRCKTLQGLSVTGELNEIIVDRRALAYSQANS